MIDFVQVEKRFGPQTVLDGVSFRINAGERVGVTGPNGAGKSTIFMLLTGEAETDSGEVVFPKGLRIGHLRQQLNPHRVGETLLEYAENSIPELKTIPERIREYEATLPSLSGPERKRVLRQVGELEHRFEGFGGYEMRSRAEAALSGLGFPTTAFERPFAEFSGGWQMRAELARTVISNPDLLLLDEPSNYLDLPSVEWLRKYVRNFEGTLMLISHDRYLLRSLCDVTLEVAGGRATRYAGGYDYYLEEREARRRHQEAARRNRDREIERIESFVRRFRAKSTKASQVQSRLKRLEKMERVAAPALSASAARLRVAPPPHCGHEIVRLENAGISYDGVRWVWRGVDLRIEKGEKIAVVGYNGMGKTTLLRTLAGALPPSEGRRTLGHKVVVGYQSQEFAETMPPDKSVFHVVKESAATASDAEVRTLLGGFGFSGDAVEKRCEILSGGEKIRLAFARLFIRPPNFLLLDEPTTHLDVAGREALEAALADYAGTLCVVSHDVEFVRHVAGRILAVGAEGVERFLGGYDYYREKTEERERAGSPASPVVETNAMPAGVVGAAKGKEARKARARRREAEKGLREIETQIDRLSEEQGTLTEEMLSDRSADFAGINLRLGEIRDEIRTLEARWEALAEGLE